MASEDTSDKLSSLRKECNERNARYLARQTYAQSVASSLGLVSALVAAALLAVLLNPPETIYNPSMWEQLGAACGSACYALRGVYGVTGIAALVLEVTVLLVALSVAVGSNEWLEAAFVLFILSLYPAVLMLAAAVWLSSAMAPAIVSSVILFAFSGATAPALAPAVASVWMSHFRPAVRIHLGNEKWLSIDGCGPVQWAACKASGKWSMPYVKLLILRILLCTRNPDEVGTHGEALERTPLMLAVMSGNRPALQLLLDAGADPNWAGRTMQLTRPLFIAVANYDMGLVSLLLRYGADPNMAEVETAGIPDPRIVPEIRRFGGNINPTLSVGRLLASAQAWGDLNDQWTCLQLCRYACADVPDFVRVLLKKVRDPNQTPGIAGRQGNIAYERCTALSAAAKGGFLEVIRVLREDPRVNPEVQPAGGGMAPLAAALAHQEWAACAELSDWLCGGSDTARLHLLQFFSGGLEAAGQTVAGRYEPIAQAGRRVDLALLLSPGSSGIHAAVKEMLAKVDDPNVLMKVSSPGHAWESPLFTAVRTGNMAVISVFCEDLRVKPCLGNKDGLSPHTAARVEGDMFAEALLDVRAGAEPSMWWGSSDEDCLQELLYRIRYGECREVDAALRRVRDPNALWQVSSQVRITALLVAVDSRRLQVVQVLRQDRRVDPLRDVDHRSALDVAREVGDPQLLQEVESWSAEAAAAAAAQQLVHPPLQQQP